jgi:aryl-alcohol dehydrogenase-like predicted oxidoreductase
VTAVAEVPEVEYVRLGSTGLKVSRLCLGMMSYGDPGWREWVLPEAAAAPFVRRAAEAGITFFDTADVYSLGVSEEITGRLLRRFFPRREDYVLATKVYNRVGDGPNDAGLSRKHIMDSIDASLRRLGVDYVDLYQIHRWDYDTPIEETMAALHDVVRAGKARYLGASSMFAWQFAKAQQVAATPFVSMQDHYNLVYREEEREMLPLCADQGVGVLPWSPLARGLLAGNRDRASQHTVRARTDFGNQSFYVYDETTFSIVDRVADVADKHGVPAARVALAWLLHQPVVTAPIVGATKPHHLDDAIAALDLELTGDELGYLTEPYQPRPISGHS